MQISPVRAGESCHALKIIIFIPNPKTMSKFVKTLIIINGLLIPAIAVIVLGSYLWNFLGIGNNYNAGGINTENFVVKDKDTLLIQGTEYGDPMRIYNSSNYYIEVNAKTYNEPPSKSMFSGSVNFEGGSPSDYDLDLMNILFLDNEFKPIRRLLDEKAYISSTSFSTEHWNQKLDSTVLNIFYRITFEDSNNDGVLNYLDNDELYMTDLGGKYLTQITNGIDIDDYEVIKNGRQIIITYNKRSGVREEYKIQRYALYDIDQKKLQYLDDINKALMDINKILIEK